MHPLRTTCPAARALTVLAGAAALASVLAAAGCGRSAAGTGAPVPAAGDQAADRDCAPRRDHQRRPPPGLDHSGADHACQGAHLGHARRLCSRLRPRQGVPDHHARALHRHRGHRATGSQRARRPVAIAGDRRQVLPGPRLRHQPQAAASPAREPRASHLSDRPRPLTGASVHRAGMPCLGWVPGRLYRPDSRGPRPEPAPVRLLVPAASPALAVACLPRRRSPDTISQRTAAPAGRGEPRQFAALTAREDEVAPRAGPLRAIAMRPQVALPACRALLTSASLTDAHLPTVTSHPAVPMVTRPADRHMPTPGWFTGSPVGTSTLGPSARARSAAATGRAWPASPSAASSAGPAAATRRTPTVPFTLRDQAFDPGEARNPAVRRAGGSRCEWLCQPA
jgi:hypothetical protein